MVAAALPGWLGSVCQDRAVDRKWEQGRGQVGQEPGDLSSRKSWEISESFFSFAKCR